jgi:hypothetical protein
LNYWDMLAEKIGMPWACFAVITVAGFAAALRRQRPGSASGWVYAAGFVCMFVTTPLYMTFCVNTGLHLAREAGISRVWGLVLGLLLAPAGIALLVVATKLAEAAWATKRRKA